MKFYIARENGHRFLHHRKDDAKAQDKNFEQIDIPTDMPGLKAFVQNLYSEIDTTTDLMVMSGPSDDDSRQTPVAVQPSYLHKSIATDEEFNSLPLAHQLHLAAIAMENARERL